MGPRRQPRPRRLDPGPAHAAGHRQPVRRHGRRSRHAPGRPRAGRPPRPTPPRPQLDDHVAARRRPASRAAARSRSAARPPTPAGGVSRRRRGLGRRRRDLAPGHGRERAGPTPGPRARPAATTIKARAVDDSGNLETPGGSVTVDVVPRTCPCSIWNDSVDAAGRRNDANAVELGVKFRSDVAGFITGLRFYKGAANTGTHVGHLWTAGGTLLAEATFTGETRLGLAGGAAFRRRSRSPRTRPTSPPTTPPPATTPSAPATSRTRASTARRCTRSQTAPTGRTASTSTAPPGGFPTDSFQSSNYWVDVVFDDDGRTGHDAAHGDLRLPANGAIGHEHRRQRDGDLQRGDGRRHDQRQHVRAARCLERARHRDVSYSAAVRRATLDPTGALAHSTTYTATVKGGAGGRQGHGRQRARERLHLVVHDRRAAAAAARRGAGRTRSS